MAKVAKKTQKKRFVDTTAFGPLDDFLSLWIDGRSVLIRMNSEDKKAFLLHCKKCFLDKTALISRLWKKGDEFSRAENIRAFIRQSLMDKEQKSHKAAARTLAMVLEDLSDTEPVLPARAEGNRRRVA